MQTSHVSLHSKDKFVRSLKLLKEIAADMNEEATLAKTDLLKTLGGMAFPADKYLPVYHDSLLFLCAYPANNHLLRLAENELSRLTAYLKKNSRSLKKDLPENSGLPFTETLTRFSPDSLGWLLKQKDFALHFDSFYDSRLTLNEVLNITLPSLLKAETTAGLNPEDLWRFLASSQTNISISCTDSLKL